MSKDSNLTLPELIDVALKKPPGLINFNVLHTILMLIFKKQKVDLKPPVSEKVAVIEKGGPSWAEFEAFNDRLSELEEAFNEFAADHKLLMEMNELLSALLKEFEDIKALAALLEQMKIDISKKADKEETWAALDLKCDVAMINNKVDRLEFETAVEELGEAIGLLGLKFTKKNEEWEERTEEIQKAIDSKMTFDVFEAARIRIESRMRALVFALRKLKKVVEDLLYPEASGVTRCILCRRPACISGLECIDGIGSGDSLKFSFPDKNVENYDNTENSVIYDAPIKAGSDKIQIKVKPIAPERQSKRKSIVKIKLHEQKDDLYFTKKLLGRAERSSSTSIDLISNPEQIMSDFVSTIKSPSCSQIPKLPDIDSNSRKV